MDTCAHHGGPDGDEAGLARHTRWRAVTGGRFVNAHEDPAVDLAPGDLLVVEHTFSTHDPRTHLLVSVFRLHVVEGERQGECVLIQTDERGDIAAEGFARA